MSQPVVCPRCSSAQLVTRDYARKAFGALGTIVGAAGSSGIFDKNEGEHRLPAEALGVAAIGVAFPIMKALLDGAAGCATGASVGSTIDSTVLNNYECLCCGITFS